MLHWYEVGGGGVLLEARHVLIVCGKNGLIKIKISPDESSRESWSGDMRHVHGVVVTSPSLYWLTPGTGQPSSFHPDLSSGRL